MVFVYHRFGDDKYPSTNISLENFEKHLDYLKHNDFRVIKFGEAVDYINNPGIAYEEKIACITIDDGYKTFWSNAMPLLKKYGFKTTLFINSESVGQNSYMDWGELKEVYDWGIEIGNHSHSHDYFLNIPENQRLQVFKNDLETCQEQINTHLGFYPDLHAYPFGEFDEEMKNILKEIGFKAAAAQYSGVMILDDNYSIPRFPMAGPFVEMEGFIEKTGMKAMRIIHKSTESSLLQENNPPQLTIEVDTGTVDVSRLNCFVTDGCELCVDGNSITIRATNRLENRRTLYTITAPSRNGQDWYWHTHLWIQPEVRE